MLQYRVTYSDITRGNPPLKITEWDALGYYIYLPSLLIYDDFTKLEWLSAIDKKYGVQGGPGIPAQKVDNGNYAFKYLGGVAIMELPFFYIGHLAAKTSGYPPDGFSPPYQYALTIGCMLYCILTIFLLRRILLRWFSDLTVAVSLLAVCLGTNFIEYAVIENGQSHGFIFPLYVLVLYTTLKWHDQPKIIWACLTGFIIGFAAICRPTEAIMLFIPLLWNTQSKESAKNKWKTVRENKSHVFYAIAFGLIGILPQLIYWKAATGSFIYDVGSSWDFLTPHFRVLFGWEKGWFIYTPITVFFIAGMFFLKDLPFRRSVLWFCLLNIYIIISWRDWRYGGSYSTRALMQSYPVFALAFAAFTEKLSLSKWRWLFYGVCTYLVAVNLFQITQYRTNVLHYDDMNRRYYSRIYLNPHPAPVDISLLDDNDFLAGEKGYNTQVLLDTSLPSVSFPKGAFHIFTQEVWIVSAREVWLKVESSIKAPGCLWNSFLNLELRKGDSAKKAHVRLNAPLCNNDSFNRYAFYVKIPPYFAQSHFAVFLNSPLEFNGNIQRLTITEVSLPAEHAH